MKRLFQSLFLLCILVSSVLMVSCANGRRSGGGGSWNNNYKCTAAAGTGGRSYTGWSTSRSAAVSNAMDKCRSNNANSKCHITGCIN